MADEFKYLFSPGKIGKLELKNRICNSAHVLNYASLEGEITQRYIDYEEERAKNGAALLILEGAYIHTDRQDFIRQVGIYDDKLIPQMRKMAEAVHKYGTKIGMQIFHPGRQGDTRFSGVPVEAPSPIPCPVLQNPPVEMTVERIKEVVKLFGQAARRIKEASFDVVELAGSHGYLINEFLSPYSNKRTDQYGGNAENRARFALEIIKEVRKQVGSDFVVGMRISGDEFVEGGLTLQDQKEFAKVVAAAGLDYISVSAGVYSIPGIKMIASPMEVPLGALEGLAAGVREVVDVPVITVGRINDPVFAEQILANGSADFVTMTRALLADPELPLKAKEGRLDDIRKCIACNQGCVDRLFSALDITCTVNPAVGREREYAIKPVEKKKKVMVIGGGPAGMECARVAALRGHNVVLYDDKSQLGGMNLYAKQLPGRDEFGGLSRWLSQQVEKVGVKINLGQKVDPQTVKAEQCDAVVVATGASFVVPQIKGAKRADGRFANNVLTPIDVLDNASVGEKVVVYGANTIGLEIAMHLKEKGKQVVVVENSPGPVQDMYGFISWYCVVMGQLQEYSLEIKGSQIIKEIRSGEVILDAMSTAPPPDQVRRGTVVLVNEERVPADTVVLAVGRQSNYSLAEQLVGLVPEVYSIGDCCQPGSGLDATSDGARIGREI